VTLPEVMEYLAHREQTLSESPVASALHEIALVGHFLGAPREAPNAAHARFVCDLEVDPERFNLFPVLHRFREKAYEGAPNTPGPGTTPETYYYPILRELLRLNRADLEVFKSRFSWAWDRCGGEAVDPSRVQLSSRCAFVFIPLPPDEYARANTALRAYTELAKYDLRAERCIGITFRRDGQQRLLEWMLLEKPWEPDASIEQLFRDNYPFRAKRETVQERYSFRE
jgi:hypothetical protein